MKRRMTWLLPSLFLVALILGGAALADSPQAGPPGSNVFEDVKYLHAYDGDTITVHISGQHALFGGSKTGIPVRIAYIDTAELRTADECEKSVALRARLITRHVLENAERIDLYDVERGKYFRLVARVLVDGHLDLGTYLIRHNLAVPYDGGRKPDTNWCTHYRFE